MSQLTDTVVRFNDRKLAIAGEAAARGETAVAHDHRIGLLVSGYDIDVEEAMMVAGAAGTHATAAILMDTAPVDAALMGLWIDGLMTGLALADVRAAAKAAAA